jgi:Ser/Thr protein kinase RdoA (MazF antagonist)
MQTAPTGSPPALLGTLRRARSGAPGLLDGALRDLCLRPLSGGRQNHVYLWVPAGDRATVIKIYRTDDRRRADREWAALTLLAAHDIGDVPRPLWIDPDPVAPAIGMTWLHGTPLLEAADRPAALQGLARTTARMQSVPVSGLLAELPRIDSASHYAHRVTVTWPAQLARQDADPLTPAMQDLLAAWQRIGDDDLLAAPAGVVVFSHGDGNLLNWLTAGDTGSACVDFEFAGHSTAAFDAADLIEHISSRVIPDAIWQDLLPGLGVSHASHRLFAAAQRTCTLRWLAVLWKQREQRAAEFNSQHDRVRLLLSHASPYAGA